MLISSTLDQKNVDGRFSDVIGTDGIHRCNKKCTILYEIIALNAFIKTMPVTFGILVKENSELNGRFVAFFRDNALTGIPVLSSVTTILL